MNTRSLAIVLTVCACSKTTATATQDATTEPADSSTPQDSAAPQADVHCSSWGTPEVTGTVQDPALDEISGIVVSHQNPGVLWVHEDSGATAVLTALNMTGETLATLTLSETINVDWEDLALGPCGDSTCLWVGDIGDNSESRDDLVILSVPEPLLDASSDTALTASPVRQPFDYPDGPQDAEALVVDPSGVPFVLTKRTDISSKIYRVPTDGSGLSTHVATISTGTVEGLPTATTAADLSSDGKRLLVRGYLYTFELTLTGASLDAAEAGSAAQVQTGLEVQGEAIAYDHAHQTIWHVSEGINPQLWRIPCAD